MVQEQDRSGWMMFDVLAERLTFSTVVTAAGAHTTVDIARMFLSAAAMVTTTNFIYQK